MTLAADEVNVAGGIDGRPLELRFLSDGDNSVEPSMALARELVSTSSVLAVAAGGRSIAVESALPVYRGALPSIVPVASPTRSTGGWAWSLNIPVEQVVQTAVDALAAAGDGPIAVIYDNTPGGQRLAAQLHGRLADRPAILQPVSPVVAGDFSPIVDAMAQRGVTRVLLLVGSRTAGTFLPLLDRSLPDARTIVLDRVLPLMGDPSLEGAWMIVPAYLAAPDRLPWISFAREFRERFGYGPDGFAALGYDTVHLLATAAREGGAERGSIAEWLSGLRSDRAPVGVTGPLWFDADGRRRGLVAVVREICSGEETPSTEFCRR